MFTLDIKELKLTPQITEERVFKGEDKFVVINEAADYIKETYKDIYNPVTVERSTRDMVKDDNGETAKDKFNRESSESDFRIKAEIATDQKLQDDVWKKYEPERKKMNEEEWNTLSSVSSEYEGKINNAGDKSIAQKLEEEMQQKLDDIKLQYRNKKEALSVKINQESKRDWVK